MAEMKRMAKSVPRKIAQSSASTKRQNTATVKKKTPAEQKSELPTLDDVLAGGKWELTVMPARTLVLAENAPRCQMEIRNKGPAIVEARCRRGEPVILLQGKFSVIPVHGRITIENLEEKWASVVVEFIREVLTQSVGSWRQRGGSCRPAPF